LTYNALTFPGAVGCVKLWCCVWCCEGAELKGFRSITPVELSDQLSSSVLNSRSRTLREMQWLQDICFVQERMTTYSPMSSYLGSGVVEYRL